MTAYQPAADVHAVDFGHSIIVLRLGCDELHALDSHAAATWRALTAANGNNNGCDSDQAALDQLVRLGFLRLGPKTPWPDRAATIASNVGGSSLGTTDVAIALDPRRPTPTTLRISAWTTLIVVTGALRILPLRIVLSTLRLARRFAQHPATEDETGGVVRAIRAASLALPGRAACLETSISAAVLLTLRGRTTQWNLGVATDPIRFHAWVQPSDDTERVADYTPLLTI